MRSRSRTHRAELALLAGVALAACGGGEPETVSNAMPDAVLAGPQGARGQFVVECRIDHVVADDPIVHPGQPGASHLHQFFGAVGVVADSTYDELLGGPTTCDQPRDTASYWAPLLVLNGSNVVSAQRSVAYYRAGEGVDPLDVVPYPPGLMMVAGDHTATEAQPLSVVAWSCGTGSQRSTTPIDCTGAPSLRMLITYPDCWNGADIASNDWGDPDARHVVYSSAGACPDSHPIHIPQLQFAVDYDPVPADQLDHLALTSGDIHSGHADFWNTWDQDKLRNEVAKCIHRDLVCNVSG